MRITQTYSHLCQCVFVFLSVSWTFFSDSAQDAFILPYLMLPLLFNHKILSPIFYLVTIPAPFLQPCIPHIGFVVHVRLVLTSSYIYYAAIFYRFSSLLWNFVGNTNNGLGKGVLWEKMAKSARRTARMKYIQTRTDKIIGCEWVVWLLKHITNEAKRMECTQK